MPNSPKRKRSGSVTEERGAPSIRTENEQLKKEVVELKKKLKESRDDAINELNRLSRLCLATARVMRQWRDDGL